MKKLLIFALLLMGAFSLAACGRDEEPDPSPSPSPSPSPTESPDPTEYTAEDIMAMLLASDYVTQPVMDHGNFPREFYGASVSWQSSDTSIIRHSGDVRSRPGYDEDAWTVDFDVTVEHDGDTVEETVAITIASLDMIWDVIEAWFDEPITDNLPLGTNTIVFSTSWESSEPHILSPTGYVNRPLHFEEDVTVTMTVTVNYSGEDEREYEFDAVIVKRDAASIVQTVSLPFISHGYEWPVAERDVDIHYTHEGGMPYVDLMTFLELLDAGDYYWDEETGDPEEEMSEGAIILENIDITIDGYVVLLEYHSIPDEDDEDDEEFYAFMEIDFENNTAIVSELLFFNAFRAPTKTDFGEGLEVYDSIYEGPEEVYDFNLTHYRIELLAQDDMLLMPFHLANMWFSGSMYDVYYNGDSLHGFDTYQRGDADIRAEMRESSRNNTAIPDQLLIDSYNMTVFSFDHFYGLREEYEIDTFYDMIEFHRFTRQGSSHYETLYHLVFDLDDLHTSFSMSGYYHPSYSPGLVLNLFGPRYMNYYDAMQGVDGGANVLQLYWGGNFDNFADDVNNNNISVMYYDNERIARIRFYGFDADTPDAFAEILDAIDEKGTVEDIIVDISANFGGIVGTMWQIIAYMTNDPIGAYNINPADGSRSATYYISETEARTDFNWYIMTSRVSYSAANMMATHAKDMGFATLIGQPTQGGAASIRVNINPTGAMMIMSSNRVSANSDYESTEFGIDPDYFLPFHQFNSGTAITNLINSIRDDMADED